VSAWKDKIDAAGPPAAEKLLKAFIIVDDNDEPVGDQEYDSEAAAQEALDAMDDSDGLSVIEKAAPVTLKKNLYTCQQLAQVVQSLNYILSSSQYEEERESDDSDIPARLNDAVTGLGQILVDMTSEEVAELTAANKDGNDLSDIPVMQMAASAKELIKRAEPLSKIGARNSAKDQGSIQGIHDIACVLGAKCVEPKTGDYSNEPADKAITADELQKLDIYTTELDKALKVAKEPLEKALALANAEIAKLKATPAPAKAVLRVFGKGEDISTDMIKEIAPVLDAGGQEHEPASLIKAMHKQGGTPLKF